MVHGSLMACIKMGVSATNTKQQASVPFFGVIGHTQMLHMLVSVGSTALAAAVVLPRYGGLNYARGINEVLKNENKISCCMILYNARVKILNKSASFTTKCVMMSKRVTENV